MSQAEQEAGGSEIVEAAPAPAPTYDNDQADPCWWSARRAAAAIASRQISAREYLAALQARTEDGNVALNAVVTLDERAAEWARQADEAVASRPGARVAAHKRA